MHRRIHILTPTSPGRIPTVPQRRDHANMHPLALSNPAKHSYNGKISIPYTREHPPRSQVSAKDNVNIDDVFTGVATRAFENQTSISVS